MIERLRVRVPAEAAGDCSFPELTISADSYSVSVPPRVSTEARGHSAKSADDRLHPNTHTPLTQRSRSGLSVLSKHSVGTIREMSSHATRQGTLGHSRLSSLSHC